MVLHEIPVFSGMPRCICIVGFSQGWLFLLLLTTQLVSETSTEFPEEEFQRSFSKASCEFALNLLKNVSGESPENLVLSPTSISVMLAILQQGANDNTASELENVLQMSANDSRIGYSNVIASLQGEKVNLTLEWGYRAFVAPGYELKDTFLEVIEEDFNATFEELNFNSTTPAEVAEKINEWVKEATHDYIQDLVDPTSLTSDAVMIMVNAIFFRSIWDSPFQKYKTRNDKFHVSSDKKVEVPFMRQAGRFVAGENIDLGIKWVELPFKDENFSMVFILPMKSNGLQQVLEKISGSDLQDIITSEATRQVKLIIPKFKLTRKVSLVDTLMKLGLNDVFTAESDLSGIATAEESLRLTDIVHQADVEVDEDGSTAAAATFEIAQTLSFEWFSDELYFKANHPFMFFIVEKLNEIPLFAGMIVDPDAFES